MSPFPAQTLRKFSIAQQVQAWVYSWRRIGESPEQEIFRRINYRHRVFARSPDTMDVATDLLTADVPLERWQAGPHWQRRLSNKYNAREYAQKHGCRVPHLYWRGGDPERLPFPTLPEDYVIRPTLGHSCRSVFLMHRGMNLLDGRRYRPHELRAALVEARIRKPRTEFLVEEFLRDEKGNVRIPTDYKFLMFNGEVAAIHVIHRAGPGRGVGRFYDSSWRPIADVAAVYPSAPDEPPPQCYEELLAHARELSRAYQIFVRLDFFATDRGAVFGEFTPTPGLGIGFTPEGGRLMIDYWDRYCPGQL